MRVAQITPLWEQVPPVGYGGTESVVSLLTEELVQRGHHVTLFASGDSETRAHLEAGCDRALRPLGMLPPEYAQPEARQLTKVFDRADQFDVIHSYMDLAALPYGERSLTPVVQTVHGILTAVTGKLFSQYHRENFISISNSQRRDDLGLNYVATVYNAIALSEVQGYVYAAKVRLSHLARLQDRPDLCDRWQAEAAALKTRFERDFWLADEGYFALTRDGQGQPVDSITSNPGHCLGLGIFFPRKKATAWPNGSRLPICLAVGAFVPSVAIPQPITPWATTSARCGPTITA